MIHFNSTVHPIDFSQLSGAQFERLVFALLVRRYHWIELDWFGQLGDDQGRDIVGVREDDWGHRQLVVVACANWQRLTIEKATGDIDKIAKGPRGLPDQVIIVAGGKVSSDLKTKAKAHAAGAGIIGSEVWSGPEVEELLRVHAESVLRRFLNGERLPDEPSSLLAFIAQSIPMSDEEGLRAVAHLFDRPAFFTPFHGESSLPAFRRAINDTIEALNTGLCRNREGKLVGVIRARSSFQAEPLRKQLAETVRKLSRIRSAFDEHLRRGTIKPCGCPDPDCPTFILDQEAVNQLNRLRQDLLEHLAKTLPTFDVQPEY